MKPARILASLFLGLVCMVSAAQATEVSKERFSHTFFGNFGGNYTMVACSYAEAVVEDFMAKFGASDIEVNCFGGIQPYGVSPITVSVDYTAPVTTGSTKTEKVTIESDSWGSNCAYDTYLMRDLTRSFKNVKATRASDHCFTTSSNYRYEFDVTTAQ